MTDHLPPVRKYERKHEESPAALRVRQPVIAKESLDRAIAESSLSDGARGLTRGLAMLGSVRVFPGGGLGIEYGSLLKTAVHPGFISDHVREAAEHLAQHQVDVLLVPGMSGYPIGSIYAFAAGLPAVLLKKNEIRLDRPIDYSPGAFAIPSYTGEGDVVMTADPAGVRSAIAPLLDAQIEAQADRAELDLAIRFAGADDIIDKGSMAIAISESAEAIGEWAIESWLAEYRARSGDTRPAKRSIDVVAWITPMIKSYNRPQEQLRRLLGITPFAGLEITALQSDPPAIEIAGLGLIGLKRGV
jgi:hypothetical protein